MQFLRFSAVLALVLGLAYVGPVAGQSRAKAKEQNLRKNLKSVQSELGSVRSELRKTRRQTSYVLNDIERVDNRLETTNEAIHANWKEQAKLKRQREVLDRELGKAETTLDVQTKTVRERIRRLYMQPQGTAVGAMLASESLGDMAQRGAIFRRIAEEDTELFKKYKARVTEVATKKKQKEALISRAKQLEEDQRARQAELMAHRKKKRGFLDELVEKQGDLEAQFKELDRESDQIAAQLQAITAQNLGGRFSGRFIRPVNGRITSGFGMRFHPVLRRSRMHAGVDFGAPTGTPIRASAAGTVVQARYMGGYGNTVVIDHGGGFATLYGHCSRLFVRTGQRVTQGQVIAAVGSTGISTGPHLHFEIRINGRPVNPVGRL